MLESYHFCRILKWTIQISLTLEWPLFPVFVIVHFNGLKWYRSCWLQLNQFGPITTSDFNSLIAFVQVLRLIIQFWKMVTGCNFKVGMIVKNLERLQQPWRWATRAFGCIYVPVYNPCKQLCCWLIWPQITQISPKVNLTLYFR